MCLTKVPQSTHSTIVFPYDEMNKLFDTRGYYPSLTDNRMSAEEVYQVLQEFQAIQKPYFQKIVCFSCIYVLLVLSLAMGLHLYSQEHPDASLEDTTPALCAYFIILLLLVFAIKFLKKKIINDARQEVQKSANRWNQVALSRGLRWTIPEKYPLWVELQKDYLLQGQPQGINLPLPNQQMFSYEMPPVNLIVAGQPVHPTAQYNNDPSISNVGYSVPQPGFISQNRGYSQLP